LFRGYYYAAFLFCQYVETLNPVIKCQTPQNAMILITEGSVGNNDGMMKRTIPMFWMPSSREIVLQIRVENLNNRLTQYPKESNKALKRKAMGKTVKISFVRIARFLNSVPTMMRLIKKRENHFNGCNIFSLKAGFNFLNMAPMIRAGTIKITVILLMSMRVSVLSKTRISD
jgi:hypothetical protein